MDYPNPELLVEADWLADHLEDTGLVVVDCAWDENAYSRAHIPGALGRPGHPWIKHADDNGEPGLFVPSAEQVDDLAATLGIGPDTRVIAYDDWGSHLAVRLWWVLRYYGHDDVAVLNGGWQAWVDVGLPVSYETPEVHTASTWRAQARPERSIGLDELVEHHADPEWQVIDARTDAEFAGDPGSNLRGGHIPGALHVDRLSMLTNGDDPEAVRRFRPADELQAILDDAGVDSAKTIVTYCQAAVRASADAFTLELMGAPSPRVYDGSMAEWANREDTPIE